MYRTDLPAFYSRVRRFLFSDLLLETKRPKNGKYSAVRATSLNTLLVKDLHSTHRPFLRSLGISQSTSDGHRIRLGQYRLRHLPRYLRYTVRAITAIGDLLALTLVR